MSLVPIDEIVFFDARVHNPATSGLVNADSTPTFDVFEENTDTPILANQAMTQRTGLTGKYRGSFVASLANGFEAGKWYTVDIKATVSGVTDSAVAAWFRCGPAETSPGTPVDSSGVTTLLSRLTAAIAAKLDKHTRAVLAVVVGTGSTSTAIVLNASTGIDGSAPAGIDNVYNDRVLIFLSGNLINQAQRITDYDQASKTLTTLSFTGAPSTNDTAIIV